MIPQEALNKSILDFQSTERKNVVFGFFIFDDMA